MDNTQQCRGCGSELPLTTSHFGPEPANKNGFRTTCRPCRAGEARVYYVTNAETLREKARKRRQERAAAFRAAGLYDAAR